MISRWLAWLGLGLVPVAVSGCRGWPSASASASERMALAGARFTNSLGMVFVAVPGTEVWFSIWDTRVRDYREYAAAYQLKWERPRFAQDATHPAVLVSWREARAFCNWLILHEQADGRLRRDWEYRLPTDAEWSVAVGLSGEPGGTPRQKAGKVPDVYPWGTQFPPPAGAGNYGPSVGVDAVEHTSPVGSFPPNRFGLYDLGGNVCQWCEDYHDSPGPAGHPGVAARVWRGSSWRAYYDAELLSSYRGAALPVKRSPYLGFRLVLADVAGR